MKRKKKGFKLKLNRHSRMSQSGIQNLRQKEQSLDSRFRGNDDFGNSFHVAIVVSKFNRNITTNLLKSCQKELIKKGVSSKNIFVTWVPGAFEIPFVAQKLAVSQKFDSIICLGCVIKGDTSHDVHVAGWAANGVGQVSLTTGVPTLFGVLTPHNEEQARERSQPGPLNRGVEVAHAALDIMRLNRSLKVH